jgi:hypothetical protein
VGWLELLNFPWKQSTDHVERGEAMDDADRPAGMGAGTARWATAEVWKAAGRSSQSCPFDFHSVYFTLFKTELRSTNS